MHYHISMTAQQSGSQTESVQFEDSIYDTRFLRLFGMRSYLVQPQDSGPFASDRCWSIIEKACGKSHRSPPRILHLFALHDKNAAIPVLNILQLFVACYTMVFLLMLSLAKQHPSF